MYIFVLVFCVFNLVYCKGWVIFFSGKVEVFFLRSVKSIYFFRCCNVWVDKEYLELIVNDVKCDLFFVYGIFDIIYNGVLCVFKYKLIMIFYW